MGIKKQGVIWAAILVLSVSVWQETAVSAARTGTANFVTTGTRQISGGDISAARQSAVSAALAQAVTQAFARVVSPQVLAANLEFMYTRILPEAQDYVVTFRVLGEIEHKNQYLVGVESRINLDLLEQTLTDARIINIGTDRPMILFLIAEQTQQDLLPRYWWGNNPEPYVSHAEDRITQVMTQHRFKVAGMGADRPEPGFYGIRFQTIYDKAAAMDLAEWLNADLVVLGRAGATESINRMGEEKIFDGVIRLNVFDVKSRQQVAAVEKQAAAKTGPDQQGDVEAIVRAADLAAAELAETLDRFWTQNLRKETRFDVLIEGNGFLPRFIALKKRFAEIQEIENIQPKEVGSGHAVMELFYKGTPAHFADSIMLKTFDGFGIEIVEVTDTLVKIRFIDDTGRWPGAPQ
jgi:hypothetical protein